MNRLPVPKTTSYRIGELAKIARVNVETVRYYQRRGLLVSPAKPSGGTRYYGADTLRTLRFIRRAQGLGFTLREIKDLLAIDRGDCAGTQKLTQRKYDDLVVRIADLNVLKKTLGGMLRRCRAGQTAGCPIIDHLLEADRK